MTTTQTRYPLAPLARALGITVTTRGGGNQPGHLQGLAAIATHLGISHRHAQRLHQHGLNPEQADRYAIRLGIHPAVLWPSWWTDTDTRADR